MRCAIIFVKYPIPGKVKTRLGAQIGNGIAAELYRVFIDLTLSLVQRSQADQTLVAYEPADRAGDFETLVPDSVIRFPQAGGSLGQRLANAVDVAIQRGFREVVVLGSDSPTLPHAFLDEAFARLDFNDLVLGPAEDGGYYLIGVKELHRRLFQGISWSTSAVLTQTLNRAQKLGLRRHLLPSWYDVDTVNDLKRALRDDCTGKIKEYLRGHQPQLLQAWS